MKIRRRRSMKTWKKAVALALCAVFLVVGTVAGTLAYLTDQTQTVTNTFTVGKVDITLTETFNDKSNPGNSTNDIWTAKLIPGDTIAKDPVVTVSADSEDCWVFVKITEKNDLSTFVDYTVRAGWTQGTGTGTGENGVPTDVYFCEVAPSGTSTSCYILEAGNGDLANGYVTVKETVTNESMKTLTESTLPSLSFTAYAVQKANITTTGQAWSYAVSDSVPSGSGE